MNKGKRLNYSLPIEISGSVNDNDGKYHYKFDLPLEIRMMLLAPTFDHPESEDITVCIDTGYDYGRDPEKEFYIKLYELIDQTVEFERDRDDLVKLFSQYIEKLGAMEFE